VLQMHMTYFTVEVLNKAFLQDLPVLFQMVTLPVYLQGIAVSLSSVVPSDQLALAWGGQGPLGNASLFEHLSGTAPPLAPMAQGFGIMDQPGTRGTVVGFAGGAVPLSAAQIAYLWDPANEYALTSRTGALHWAGLLYCGADQESMMQVGTECFKAGTDGWLIRDALGLGLSLTGSLSVGIVMQWISEVIMTPIYFTVVKGVLVSQDAGFQNVTSWRDLGALQFGTGLVSQALGGAPSLFHIGALPPAIPAPPEISAFAGARGQQVTSAGGLTMQQARQFLRRFNSATTATGFLMAAQQAASGDTGPLASFIASLPGDVGLELGNAQLYVEYMYYLATEIFIPGLLRGGPLRPDGTYPSNAGLFVRVTPQQYMEGWADPMVSLLYPNETYNGILGYQHNSSQERDGGADPTTLSRSAYLTGIDDISTAGDWVMIDNVSEFTRRDDLDSGACEDFYTTLVLRDADTCRAWASTERIAGLKRRGSFPPYPDRVTRQNYDKVLTPQSKVLQWVPGFMRAVELERTHMVEVKGVRAQHYDISLGSVLGDCSQGESPCNPANAKYYMEHGHSLFPVERVNEGLPLTLSGPFFLGRHGTREDVRSCLDLSSFPSEFDEEAHGSWQRVEPITGFAIEGTGRVQINLNLFREQFSSVVSAPIFNATGCNRTFWPMYVIDSHAVMSDENKETFELLFFLFELEGHVSIAAAVLGALLIVLGCAGLVMTVRSWSKPAAADQGTSNSV